MTALTESPTLAWLFFAIGCLAVGAFFGHVIRVDRVRPRRDARTRPGRHAVPCHRPHPRGGPTPVSGLPRPRNPDHHPARGRAPVPHAEEAVPQTVSSSN